MEAWETLNGFTQGGLFGVEYGTQRAFGNTSPFFLRLPPSPLQGYL